MEHELLELLVGDVAARQCGVDVLADRLVDRGRRHAGQGDPTPVPTGEAGPVPELAEHRVHDPLVEVGGQRRRCLRDHHLLVPLPSPLGPGLGDLCGDALVLVVPHRFLLSCHRSAALMSTGWFMAPISPPSTRRSQPEMKAARSEHRKATASAMSPV